MPYNGVATRRQPIYVRDFGCWLVAVVVGCLLFIRQPNESKPNVKVYK